MRSIFVGTVEISWHCLRTLLEMREEVVAIFTMLEERAPFISAYKNVSDLGQQYGLPVHRHRDVNSEQSISVIRRIEPEIIYVIGWPRLVKRPLLNLPRNGCIGIHSSLLPKYRGGAPVNWGLINGETEWGISLMYLDDAADTGDIIAQERFQIAPEDTCKTVYDKATTASIRILREFVPLLARGTAPRNPQDDSQATLYPQRKPHQGEINWNRTAWQLYNWIRAQTHPYPGAFTFLPDGRKLLIWQADIPGPNNSSSQDVLPGTVLTVLPGRGMAVQTADGYLLINKLQAEGDVEQPADMWATNGNIMAGMSFGSSPNSQLTG